MECYRANRETAHEPRRTRGGRMETEDAARYRGNLDIAMIGLMRDVQLLVRETTELTWADIEPLPDGSGTVFVRHSRAGAVETRPVSSSTMRALAAVERSGESVLNLRPKRAAVRISQAAQQAGLDKGYRVERPWTGMLVDLDAIATELLREVPIPGIDLAPHAGSDL